MNFHLFEDPWIPVRDATGTIHMIVPAQLGRDPQGRPWAGFASPRADLDAALAQFCIGLIQTVMPTKREGQWMQRLGNPPDSDELARLLAPLHAAFWLCGGEGQAHFMQEYGELEGSQVPVTDLFVNAPGENTRTKNAAFFIKEDPEGTLLSPQALAIALFTLQINAFGGGPGYRTSIRGGGPLTTLLLGEDLWQTLWGNTLLSRRKDARDEPLSDIFPWCAPTRLSHKGSGVDTMPDDVDELQAYWAMPWRLRVVKAQEAEEGACALYGSQAVGRFRLCTKNNYGVNYAGPWRHPLTPYRVEKDKKTNELVFISQKGGSRTLRYTSWPSLVLEQAGQTLDTLEPGGTTTTPASTISHYGSVALGVSDKSLPGIGQMKVWVFGYEMDNAKALQWHEAVRPMIHVPPAHLEKMNQWAKLLVDLSELVESLLYFGLRKVIAGKAVDRSKQGFFIWEYDDSSRSGALFGAPLDAYWSQTAPGFFEHLEAGLDAMKAGNAEGFEGLKTRWFEHLRSVALGILNAYSPRDTLGLARLGHCIRAQQDTGRLLQIKNRKVQEILGSLAIHSSHEAS